MKYVCALLIAAAAVAIGAKWALASPVNAAVNAAWNGPQGAAPTITANGRWRVKLVSGEGLGSGDMMLHQAGAAVVGSMGDVTIDGKMVSADKVAATWKSTRGGGWLSIWLEQDGSSLHGDWGCNGKSDSGRFVGHRVEGK